MTNERRGFKTREAAEHYQMAQSIDPPFCVLHPANRGAIFVRDPVHHAGGRVYVYSYRAKSRAGDIRTYFASYVGA
jgi:hypothetical protein